MAKYFQKIGYKRVTENKLKKQPENQILKISYSEVKRY